MVQKKKLQVFVSSTYTDLLEERQATVQAILTAGHIPAGMELFAAGDESQLNVIKRWIDESDAFMLILGGRYGSIEPESGKSYIHLEYEYALEQGKPTFAVVITEEHLDKKVRNSGIVFIERENTEKLKKFRAFVLTKLVEFWDDPRDIQLSVMKTMADFSRREDLGGWIPGDQAVNAVPLAEELARLTRENSEMRERLSKTSGQQAMYNGLTFEQLYSLLSSEPIDISGWSKNSVKAYEKMASILGDDEPNALHNFWLFRTTNSKERVAIPSSNTRGLERLGLMSIERVGPSGDRIKMSDDGRKFLLRLMLEFKDKEFIDLAF